MGEHQPLHLIGDGGGFGPFALEEFQACRCCVKEVRHLHPRALGNRRGADAPLAPGIHRDSQAMRLALMAGGDGETRHRANGGQRLAAKAEGADVQKVIIIQLGGGMALDTEVEIGPCHA